MSPAARLDAVRARTAEVYGAAGYRLVEPPIFAPADTFLERLGEQFRQQTCFFEDGTGEELCLRPEITIPVCRMALDDGFDGTAPLRLRYAGPVFRLDHEHGGRLAQTQQAGGELLGAGAGAEAEAEVVALALRALEACGLGTARIALGDAGAFADLVSGLDLTDRQRARLKSQFDAHGSALAEHLPQAEDGKPARVLDLDLARAEVEATLEARSLTITGQRTVEDIALRLADRSGRAEARVIPPPARAALQDFFRLHVPMPEAAQAVAAFFRAARIESRAAERQAALAGALARAGVALDRVTFDAGVHAPLGYYTGLEFRVHANGTTYAGGGRYDSLIGELAGRPGWRVPAVGCALFLDAVAEAA
ncbi:MAG: ATP phosphoribosyltransferase regulatory subunit [Alphaproteobacteria bacterium]|nr:ATP phosphoribosyltransferase regulatory subunit [Alphaproteobacteria bacterium]